MILHLHHRYRTVGGEERAISLLRELAQDRLGVQTGLLERESSGLSAGRAARGLLRGGLDPKQVAEAVKASGATVLHAHNLHPTLGYRALKAARESGARVVLHLHNYRLVCAVGTCVRDGQDCIECHGSNTLPGLKHGCRGSLAEGLAYAAGVSRQRQSLIDASDVVVVPSQAARERLLELGAAIPDEKVQVLAHPVPWPEGPPHQGGAGAIVAGRLAPEKGTEVAIEAARITGLPLVVANIGPLEDQLQAQAADLPNVTFAGRLNPEALSAARAKAAVELVPSLAHETFGLAAAEAMLAGLPVVASDVGALRELVPADARVPAGDADALAATWQRIVADPEAGSKQLAAARALTDPAQIAAQLAEIYQLPSA